MASAALKGIFDAFSISFHPRGAASKLFWELFRRLGVAVVHRVLPRLLVDDLVLLLELRVLSPQLLELLVLTSSFE